jgi:hypothetical protein
MLGAFCASRGPGLDAAAAVDLHHVTASRTLRYIHHNVVYRRNIRCERNMRSSGSFEVFYPSLVTSPDNIRRRIPNYMRQTAAYLHAHPRSTSGLSWAAAAAAAVSADTRETTRCIRR